MSGENASMKTHVDLVLPVTYLSRIAPMRTATLKRAKKNSAMWFVSINCTVLYSILTERQSGSSITVRGKIALLHRTSHDHKVASY